MTNNADRERLSPGERRNSGRLIDADEFKDYIELGYKDNRRKVKAEYKELAGAITEGILKDIDEQPTAYDVDKVVERLENRAGFADAKANNPSIPDERAYQYGAARDAYLSAIEIVKKGRVE